MDDENGELVNPDEYWTDDQLLCEAPIEGSAHQVRMRIHHSAERYPSGHGRTEILPVADRAGMRDYIHIHPYILVPDITLAVRLAPSVVADDALGMVESTQWEGMRHLQIGNGQAWFYRADGVLILWELELWPHFRAHAQESQDVTLLACWQGFGAYLQAQFPSARVTATPSWEPGVAPEEWQSFLTRLGFHPDLAAPEAYSKGR